MNPIIHTIADDIGHVDLNDTRVVFGTSDNMLPNPDAYPLADPRAIVLAKHVDHRDPTVDEFIVILEAVHQRWPDRPIYIRGEGSLAVLYAGRTH
jgi:hypothetical protein